MPLVDRLAWIIDRCRGRRVLNLGCMHSPQTAAAIAAGVHLHLRLQQVCADLTGVDLDLQDRHLLPPDSDTHRICRGDVCCERDLWAAILSDQPDMVVAGELLEHLLNPGLCLTFLAKLCPHAELIVTVPNALARTVAADARRGVETVHADHVAWYSPCTITRLLELTGWTHNTVCVAGVPGTDYCRGNLGAPSILVLSRRT